MDFEATRHLQPEMQTTERLMWSGRPPQGLRFRREDIPIVVFGIAWTGFALYWTWNIWQNEGALFPTLTGGAMVLIGVHQFVGRFFVDAFIRAHTWYGVSDSRLVVLTDAPVRSLRETPLAELPEPVLETSGIDAGVIEFGAPEVDSGPDFRPGRRRRRRRLVRRGPIIELDNGARSAYEIIRRARQDALR
jgi:hypothetical protein